LIKQIDICHVSGCMQFILYHENTITWHSN
jgi:hypothetical protein